MFASPVISKRTAGRRPKAGKTVCDTRAEILSAARRVFARKGLDGASVREVAAAAKVNNAMIYYHFADKVELYRAVLSDSFTAFDRIWDHAVFASTAKCREKIRKYVEELVRFQHANEELRRILSMEFASCGRNFKWIGDNLFNQSYRKLTGILKEGIKNGELKKSDLTVAVASLVGIVVHSFIMRPVAEYVSGNRMNLDIKEFGEFVTGLFFDGLGTGRHGQNGRKTGSVRKRRRLA